MGKYDDLFQPEITPQRGKYADLFEPDPIEIYKAREAAQGPSFLERGALGAASGIGLPVSSFQAFRDPSAGGIDKASAVAGDVGGAAATGAMALASGGVAPAARALLGSAAMGAAQGAIAPVMEGAGRFGSAISKMSGGGMLASMLPENSQNTAVNFMKQIPEAGGEILGKLAPGLAMNLVGGRMTQPKVKNVPKGQEAQALARTMQRDMGLPVKVPKSSKPNDVFRAFSETRQNLGAAVGKAKEGMFQTTADVPLIVGRVASQGLQGMKDKGLISTKYGVAPELSANPEVAKYMVKELEKLGGSFRDLSPAQAMEVADNMIRQFQGKEVELKRTGSTAHPAAPMMKSAIENMTKALESLAPEEAVKVAKEAKKAFSKMATLDVMASKASRTMAQEGPRFNPRRFLFSWETMPPAQKAKTFTPKEIEAMDFLTSQKEPNPLVNMAQKGMLFTTGILNKIGNLGLKHHPATRFKEMVNPKLGKVASFGKMGNLGAISGARQPEAQEKQRKRAEQQLNMILDRMGAK